MATKERRPPVLRSVVTVNGKLYDVLYNAHSDDWPVFVASATQDGFWIVRREGGTFKCTCPASLWRGRCSHTKAAQEAMR